MRCPFCSFEIDDQSPVLACKRCSSFAGCKMVKCPRCGYEVPPEPKWAKTLRKLFRKEK